MFGRWLGVLIIIAALLTASALPLLSPIAAKASSPDVPINESPDNGTYDISLVHTFWASAFSDKDEGNSHYASQWQITTKSGDYTNPVYDSGVDTDFLTMNTVEQGYLNVN